MNSFANNVSIGHQIIITQFSNDVLLLYHLNFLDENLEVDEWKIIEVLEEYPELGHGCSIDDLHQLRNIHVLIALKAFVWHMTLMCEFFEYI